MKTPLESALILAAHSHLVFPCAANKAPTCPTEFKAATKDPNAIKRLWARHSGPLVGVPTGAASGFDVLDIDVKHPEATNWLTDNRYRLPQTRTHGTRSGGCHLLFQHSRGLRCSTSKIALGVDTRGEGGYIIWWPAADLPVLSDAPVALWPAWLLDLLQERPTSVSTLGPKPVGDRALAGLVRTIANALEGQRNSLLFWAACRIAEGVRAGSLSEAFARAILEEAARRSGLSAREARGTIESALRRVGAASRQ